MRYCKECVMPDTRPDTPFNKDGICSACITVRQKETIDWEEREAEFKKLVNKYRTESNYDCIIPVSGGKDSTFQVLRVTEYGLTPLCVCFETTLPTEVGEKNLASLRSIGVDLIHIKRDHKIVKNLTSQAFRQEGNALWPLFLGAYVSPIVIAKRFNIPLVIWGENPQQEYGGQADDAQKVQLDRHWVFNLGGINEETADKILYSVYPKKKTLMYHYPTKEEIKDLGLNSIFLGYYFKWDQRAQLKLIKKIGWYPKEGNSENSYTNYNGIDCDALSIHDYLKYVKYGFGRATDDACLDIRNNRITRGEAIRLVNKYQGKIPVNAKKRFIQYLGILEQEYNEIIDSFTNDEIFLKDSDGKWARDLDGSLIRLEEALLVEL